MSQDDPLESLAAGDTGLSEPSVELHEFAQIGRFASGIAHDLHALLVPIAGLAQALGARLPDDADVQMRVRRLVEAAELGRDLTDQIVAYAKRRMPARTPLALGSIVRRMLPLLRAMLPAGVELRASIDRDTPLMHGDLVSLQRVLLNLVLNAAGALPARNGVIEIGVVGAAVSGSEGEPGGVAPERARITVADNGSGIDALALDDLRGLLARSAESPLEGRGPGGLGLPIVARIVRAHCGSLSIVSHPKRGTTVRVDFPAIVPDRDGRIPRTHVCGEACRSGPGTR